MGLGCSVLNLDKEIHVLTVCFWVSTDLFSIYLFLFWAYLMTKSVT